MAGAASACRKCLMRSRNLWPEKTMKYAFNTWAYGSFPAWLPSYPLDEAVRPIATIGDDGVEIGCGRATCVAGILEPGKKKRAAKSIGSSLFGFPPIKTYCSADPHPFFLRGPRDSHQRRVVRACRLGRGDNRGVTGE